MDQLLIKEIRSCLKLRNLFFPVIGYVVGGGFVSYIGITIELSYFWLGLVILILFSLSSDFLSCFFNVSERSNNNKKEIIILKNNLLFLTYSFLTIGAIFTVLLYSLLNSSLLFFIFVGLFFLILVASSIPPFSLRKKGYSDLLLSIKTVALAPFFSLFLQIGEIHHILFLIAFPAIFLILAYFLAQSLENYYENLINQSHTLMTRLGWNLGMKVHNYFILLTYILYGIAGLFGLSGLLAYPAWLSLPFAGIQFWEMWRIGEGYKPRWKLLKLSALGSISTLAYFYIFILWLR